MLTLYKLTIENNIVFEWRFEILGEEVQLAWNLEKLGKILQIQKISLFYTLETLIFKGICSDPQKHTAYLKRTYFLPNCNFF